MNCRASEKHWILHLIPKQCWLSFLLNEDTLGTNLMMESFTIKVKGFGDHPHSSYRLWTFSVTPLRTNLRIIIPSNYSHVLHKWALDQVTTFKRNVNICHTSEMLWADSSSTLTWRRGHVNKLFSGTSKTTKFSLVCVTDCNHKSTVIITI